MRLTTKQLKTMSSILNVVAHGLLEDFEVTEKGKEELVEIVEEINIELKNRGFEWKEAVEK